MPGFVLQIRARADGDSAIRVGYTVTKKIGNAVVRNRMKRRFRELAREHLPITGIPGADHVLIGRAGGVERNFATLSDELARALRKASTVFAKSEATNQSTSAEHDCFAPLAKTTC
jgi:ribonuclease P protein component